MDSKIQILLLVALFGLAASTPPNERQCDNEEDKQTPTNCSNLKYIRMVEKEQTAFSKKLKKQKASADRFETETTNKFKTVNEQLKTTAKRQQDEIETLRKNIKELTSRLGERADAAADGKVAFSATVVASPRVFTGPATNERNRLIFNQVITNIGNAYSPKTGLFTAPVRGVYHFSFMTFGFNSYTSGAILVKNGREQVSTRECKSQDVSDTTSNSVILQLNARDTVNINLWRGGKIHTAVFSGFLLF